MQVPELVAHRGYAARYPENTLAAYRAALDAGARWVETDVQLSEDGVPFLFHDRSLERMTGLKGPLANRTSLELDSIAASFPARFGEKFARERVAKLADFAELLRTREDVRPFVELKRVSLDHFGVELVLDRVLAAIAPLGTRPVLISFSLEALAEARKRSRLAIGPVFDHWRDHEDPRTAELAPEFVFCDADGLPSSGELRHAGARVAVYEVDDAAVARSLAARGVELVETFSIAELAAALRAAP